MPYPASFYAVLLAICLPVLVSTSTQALELNSGEKQVALVELYTSEGCSSCPPADRWLGSLKQDPNLWHGFVPLAFHVGYWDQLGWPDRFADPAHDRRQRDYRRLRISSGVYTPGFFVAGKEWRQWFRGPRTLPQSSAKVGNLQLLQQGRQVQLSFQPSAKTNQKYRFHLVLLADRIDSPIGRGENRGKNLSHHFVVLDWQQAPASNVLERRFLLPVPTEKALRYGVAAWVSSETNPQAIQAVGGWLAPKQKP